jgi:hypothetical protein
MKLTPAMNAPCMMNAMRRTLRAAALVVMGLAGLAALGGPFTPAAWADVRVFVTSSADGYGLDLLGPQGDGTGIDPEHEDWPIDPFRPTYSTQYGEYTLDYGWDYTYGYYRAAAYPPIDAPSGTPDDPILIDTGSSPMGYLWFQFRNEPGGSAVNGFMCSIRVAGGSYAEGLSLTYYVQNNRWEDGKKRFDGYALPPEYENWHANPFITDQIGSTSIRNLQDDPVLMFDQQAGGGGYATGVALLGALAGLPGEQIYEFTIEMIDYTDGTVPMEGEHGFFKIVPEPGSLGLLLVATAALAGRRR